MSYQIFTDATADLGDYMTGLPHVEVIPMDVEVGGRPYTYGPGGNLTVPQFYSFLRSGEFASTSQINPAVYRSYFERTLKQGQDILYLCFTSGLSGTIQRARMCVDELRQEYPQRKIVCMDTLCASLGEGFFVREAARMQAEGMGFDELVCWAEAHRLKVCHWFTVDTFEHLRHGGRVSGAAAAAGTLLQIKPLLHVDNEGRLEVVSKPRGRKRAIETQLKYVKEGWTPELGHLILVGHGDCPDEAQQLRDELHLRFPEAELYIADIGPVIGAHTGPGMLAVLYWGNNR